MSATDEGGKPFHTFKDLMAQVGTFLYQWSLLEQGLAPAIDEARGILGIDKSKVRGSTSERLELWYGLAIRLHENQGKMAIAEQVRDQAMRLAKVRNLIVHGLEGGNSAPRDGRAGFIRCAVGAYDAPTGEIVCFTLDQLEDFTEGVDACRRALMRLDYFNYLADVPQLDAEDLTLSSAQPTPSVIPSKPTPKPRR